MKNREYLEKILPHRQPMILIDDVIAHSLTEKWLKSVVTIDKDSFFYNEDIQGIDSVAGIEFMAQTIGCYAYFRKNCKVPKRGYLLGTRLYNNALRKFELGKTYYILVKEIFAAEIFSFECFIYNEENNEVASATLNVYQED